MALVESSIIRMRGLLRKARANAKLRPATKALESLREKSEEELQRTVVEHTLNGCARKELLKGAMKIVNRKAA